MSGLVLKNVNKIYPGGQQSVKDFSLEIRDREFLILVGPAGCGKSALLRMIGGLDEISSGSLFIDGKDMTDADPKDRNIAMLFKNSVLYPGMTVEDNLSFALRMGKMAQEEIDRRIREISGYLKLSDILDKKPEELTGEETYRALLGRAMMRRPGILLLDSTIADLEESLQKVMRKEFKDIHKKMDMTVIYVTDNQETALALGTRMVVMNEGSICQDGTPEELAAHPANCFVGGVVGRSPMNFFLMKVFSEGGRIGLQGASGRMLVPEAVGAVLENNGYVGKEVITGVRAEDVCLSRASEDGQDGHFSARFQRPCSGSRLRTPTASARQREEQIFGKMKRYTSLWTLKRSICLIRIRKKTFCKGMISQQSGAGCGAGLFFCGKTQNFSFLFCDFALK